jgi:hypothetical protein
MALLPIQQDEHGCHLGNVSRACYFTVPQASIAFMFADLSACDYFLWGYLEAKVYTARPRTIDELMIVVRKQISVIPGNMVR